MTVDAVAFAKALADDTRQRIMKIVCCEWLSVGDVVERLAASGESVSQPTVSHHLNILKDAGLVSWRREGKRVFYTLNQQQVAVCCGLLLTRFAPDSPMRLVETAGPPGSEK